MIDLGTIKIHGQDWDDVMEAIEEMYRQARENGVLTDYTTPTGGFRVTSFGERPDVPRETSEGTCTEGARRPQCYPFHSDDCPYA